MNSRLSMLKVQFSLVPSVSMISRFLPRNLPGVSASPQTLCELNSFRLVVIRRFVLYCTLLDNMHNFERAHIPAIHVIPEAHAKGTALKLEEKKSCVSPSAWIRGF